MDVVIHMIWAISGLIVCYWANRNISLLVADKIKPAPVVTPANNDDLRELVNQIQRQQTNIQKQTTANAVALGFKPKE